MSESAVKKSKDLFREANRMLDEEPDKFAISLKDEQPEFFNEYMWPGKLSKRE